MKTLQVAVQRTSEFRVFLVCITIGTVCTAVSLGGELPDLAGPFGVASDHFFYDDHRNVETHLWYPVAPEARGRPLEYSLFSRTYESPFIGGLAEAPSVAEGQFPLVVLSHGTPELGAFALQFALAAESLASHGYIVAAPQSVAGDQAQFDDVTSVTEHVLKRSQTEGDKLFQHIDHDAMAFGGYSAGGGDAYRSVLAREPTVANLAMIQIEGASGGSTEVTVPSLAIGGDNFNDVSLFRYAHPMHGVHIDNAHNWSFGTNGCQFDPNWVTNWLGCDPDLRPATEVQEIMAQHMVAFLEQYLKGNQEFSAALEPELLSGQTKVQSVLATDDRDQELTMLLTDPAGRKLGFDGTLGEVVREFGSRRGYQDRGYQHFFSIDEEDLIAGDYELVGIGSADLPSSGVEMRTTVAKIGSTSFGEILVRRDLPTQIVLPGTPLSTIVIPITPEEAGDCSGDGLFNADDLTCARSVAERDAALSALNVLAGDFDLNGSVDFADFLTLAANFGESEASYLEGNVNTLAGVDFADYLEFSFNFETAAQIRPVPEPAARAHCRHLLCADGLATTS